MRYMNFLVSVLSSNEHECFFDNFMC